MMSLWFLITKTNHSWEIENATKKADAVSIINH